jgi:hypothetical protein
MYLERDPAAQRQEKAIDLKYDISLYVQLTCQSLDAS